MKLAVSSASMPSLTPTGLVAQLGGAGYSGVEWRMAAIDTLSAERPWEFRSNNRCTVAPTLAAVREIRAACADAGVTIVSLSPYLTVGDLDGGRRLLELAAEAGSHRLRLWAPRSDAGSYFTSCDRMVAFLEALVPHAAAHDVQLALEVHQDTICASASLAMRIAGRFDPRVVTLIYDIGNLAVEGYEFPAMALELMGPHLGHVQIKNAAPRPAAAGQGWTWDWCPMESGVLPLERIVRLLAASGFDDWISVEDFSTQHSDADKLVRNRAWLAAWLQTPGSS